MEDQNVQFSHYTTLLQSLSLQGINIGNIVK